MNCVSTNKQSNLKTVVVGTTKVKKAEPKVETMPTMDTLHITNSRALKAAHNPYDLRNGKVFFIHPSSKSEESRHENKCPPPPLLYKWMHKDTNENNNKYPKIRALGKKGHLSPKYNRNIHTKYIDQLFIQKDKIGEGSFGTVHEYESLEDNKMYAIKILTTRNKRLEVLNLDAVNEVPYCIQYYNAWEEEGLVYIQLELGVMSLSSYAEKNNNITEEECWDILHDVSNALDGLHELGFCHLDVKPDNIIITVDGKYKLCDFGLLFKYNKNQKINAFNDSEGDAKYIASEILQGNITPAGDIFSLGISLMEITMDFVLPVNGDLWNEIRNSDWRTLAKGEKRRISNEMEQTLNWMMSAQPEHRPSARQLLSTPQIRMRTRSKKTRFNYFGAWLNGYKAQQGPQVIPMVVINADSTLGHPASSQPGVEDDNMKTPPRRISSILICRRSQQFPKVKTLQKD